MRADCLGADVARTMRNLPPNLDPVPVSRDKTLALIGVSDHEAAHLRLIMRKAAPDLVHRWHWGEEGSADLLVIDVQSFAGQMARARAQGAGLRFAIFSDVPAEGAGLVLHRPVRIANVIALLNEAGAAMARRPEFDSNDAGFYVRDIGDIGDSVDEPGTPSFGVAAENADHVHGLDDLLRPQSADLRAALDQLQAHWTAPPTRGAAAVPGTGNAGQSSEPTAAIKYTTRTAMLADTTPYGLRAYLEGDLLGGPARHVLAGKTPLVLDPKLKVAAGAPAIGSH